VTVLRDDYLPGVPSWIDLMQADVERTMQFYADLFGWTYEVRTPPDAPMTYAYARLDGGIVAGVGGPPQPGDAAGWTMFVAVADADATADAVVANGGKVLSPPTDIPDTGRVAMCADPHGAPVGLFQAGSTKGVEQVNVAGSWNFNELHTPDVDAAAAFYAAVFGWECDRFDMGGEGETFLFRMPGYGAFLAERDPEIAAWQQSGHDQAPPGFADAVAWMAPADPAGPADAAARWATTFGVADADAAYARALELGAVAVSPLRDTAYTRDGVVRDPQGAELTLSEYRPPST
jgi:predicted enzyme related to lactoylglutathione lyase